MSPDPIEQLVLEIQSMGRAELTSALLQMESRFPMDFSRDFLDNCPLERLRHILLAARLYARRGESGPARNAG